MHSTNTRTLSVLNVVEIRQFTEWSKSLMKEAHDKSKMDSDAWERLRQEEREWYKKADMFKESLNKRLYDERVRVHDEAKRKERERMTEEQRKKEDEHELALTPEQKKQEQEKIEKKKEKWTKRAELLINQMIDSDDPYKKLQEIEDPFWKQAMVNTITGASKERREKEAAARERLEKHRAELEVQRQKEEEEKKEREKLYADIERMEAEKEAQENLELDCLTGKPLDGSLDSQEG